MSDVLPTLFVPGLNCSVRLYEPQIPALWRFGPTMVADHRRDNSMEAIAEHIFSHAPPRFALAGLSMGGYIALTIMRMAPDRVVKLALLDTSARPDRPEQTERRLAQIAFAQQGRFDEVVDALFPFFVHRSRHADVQLKRIVRLMAEETGPDAFVRQQKAIMARPDARPMLGSIKCPTLVLVGEGDELTPPALSQEIAAGIAGARLVVVPDCGHLSTLEQPDVVNRALIDWMAS